MAKEINTSPDVVKFYRKKTQSTITFFLSKVQTKIIDGLPTSVPHYTDGFEKHVVVILGINDLNQAELKSLIETSPETKARMTYYGKDVK